MSTIIKTRRLNRELMEVVNKYNVRFFSQDEIILYINDIGEIKLSIPNDYPFKKPTVSVNNQKYLVILRNPTSRYQSACQKLFDICCLECTSFLCDNNWNIGIRLDMIIQEVIKNTNLKKKIMNYFLLESIKIKNNIPHDIDLLQYL